VPPFSKDLLQLRFERGDWIEVRVEKYDERWLQSYLQAFHRSIGEFFAEPGILLLASLRTWSAVFRPIVTGLVAIWKQSKKRQHITGKKRRSRRSRLDRNCQRTTLLRSGLPARNNFRLVHDTARDTKYSLAIVSDLFRRDSFGLESRKASWYLRRVRSRRQQVRAKGQAHCQSEVERTSRSRAA